MNNNERYNLIKGDSIKINNSLPYVKIPKPNSGNYNEGYIERYFLQVRDTPGSPIYEVDNLQYIKFLSFEYYKGVSIKWRITGNLVDEFLTSADGQSIKAPSIISTNNLSIETAAKEMPDIKLHLVDKKQFWKPL